jgi:hypothetical protein
MEAMTTLRSVPQPSFTRGAAHFVPPEAPWELDFTAWIAERTPAGAAAVALRPPGTRSGVRLPQLRPPIPSPSARIGRRRRGTAPAVHTAYLADIGGVSPRQMAASGVFDFATERSARQHIRDGRLTLSDLGVWPWAVVDGKPLPRNWWADRDFALALEAWAMEGDDLVAARAVVRQLRARRYTAAARLPVA